MKELTAIALIFITSTAFCEEIKVRYRSALLETNGTGLVEYAAPQGSFLTRVLHDEEYNYLVVQLDDWSNPPYYHYCGVPKSVVTDMISHSVPGRYYSYEIKGHYDCRINEKPPY
jgi:hypothetical protein